MALRSRHLPSPKTPSTSLLLSQSLNLGRSFFTFLSFPLSRKTAELAFTDSHVVPIAGPPNLGNFHSQFLRKLERLGAI
jgi:hypothetical protein